MKRTFPPALLIAFAITTAPVLTSLAQNDQQSKDAPTGSSNSADQQKQTDDSANSGSQESQSNQQPSSPSTQSPGSQSADDAAPNTTQQQSASGQSTSERANNTTNNQSSGDNVKRSETRSVLKDGSTDNQVDRQSNNRDSRDSTRDDRNRSRRQDFSRDFTFGASVRRGLTVNTLRQNSIFYRSGLRDGDIIVSYNGRPIRSRDDFGRVVVYQPGQRVPVVVLRNGSEETIYVVYENEVAQSPGQGNVLFGAEFDQQVNDATVIVSVQQGSPADRAGLKRDDLVVALNGQRVASGRDATQLINSLRAGDRVEIEYTRQARTEAVLGGPGHDNGVDTAANRTDKEASVAIGVDEDETQRIEAERDRTRNTEDRREGPSRGILPRLRNR